MNDNIYTPLPIEMLSELLLTNVHELLETMDSKKQDKDVAIRVKKKQIVLLLQAINDKKSLRVRD